MRAWAPAECSFAIGRACHGQAAGNAFRFHFRWGCALSTICLSSCRAVALWLGMAKAGVCTALVNIHIKGPPLVHAIRVALEQSKRKVVMVDQSLAACVLCHEVLAELPAAVSDQISCNPPSLDVRVPHSVSRLSKEVLMRVKTLNMKCFGGRSNRLIMRS